MSAALSGLLLLPVTAGQVTAAVVATRILRRTGVPHMIPVVGMSVTSAALLLLGLVPSHVAVVIVLGFITGLGLGTVMPINQAVVQTVAGRKRLGTVMAMISLARSTGGATGAALFGALIFAMLPETGGRALIQNASALEVETVVRAFHRGFLFAAAVAALAAFTAYRIPSIALWERAKS